ncbi:histone-like protein [Geodermatophilus siccatus]|uniref:histone-like protein n=1 Tax=Geodermatophilus siccatus TaxID=1137991 RepID=UPI000B87E0EB
MSLDADAGAALADAHADFLTDLTREAIRLARKDRLRTVDAEHVEQAVSRLGMGSSQSKAGSAFSTMGGLLAGAGLAGGYALAFTSGPHSTAEMVTTIALCILGFFLLAVGLTLTMVSKR